MKKKGIRTRRAPATNLLETPSPMDSPPIFDSPSSFVLNSNKSTKISSKISLTPKIDRIARNRGITGLAPSTSIRINSPSDKTLSSISDLKDFSSSRLHDLKSYIDHSHSHIFKEFEACQTRLSKRLKIHTQACQQLMDDEEKEFKKMSERIIESQNTMKASYEEFIAHEQSSASRVRKTSLIELSNSIGKKIDAVRCRFGIAST